MSADEIYNYFRYGIKKQKRHKAFKYSADSVRSEQKDINCVVINRKGSRAGVFFLNFHDEARPYRAAISKVINKFIRVGWKAHGFYFLRIEFCFDFCPYKDLNSDGTVNAKLIMAKLIAAHKREFIRRLKLKNVNDPDCLCPTIRASETKAFIWVAPDGERYIINSGDF